jgi:hypothetical protein
MLARREERSRQYELYGDTSTPPALKVPRTPGQDEDFEEESICRAIYASDNQIGAVPSYPLGAADRSKK